MAQGSLSFFFLGLRCERNLRNRKYRKRQLNAELPASVQLPTAAAEEHRIAGDTDVVEVAQRQAGQFYATFPKLFGGSLEEYLEYRLITDPHARAYFKNTFITLFVTRFVNELKILENKTSRILWISRNFSALLDDGLDDYSGDGVLHTMLIQILILGQSKFPPAVDEKREPHHDGAALNDCGRPFFYFSSSYRRQLILAEVPGKSTLHFIESTTKLLTFLLLAMELLI